MSSWVRELVPLLSLAVPGRRRNKLFKKFNLKLLSRVVECTPIRGTTKLVLVSLRNAAAGCTLRFTRKTIRDQKPDGVSPEMLHSTWHGPSMDHHNDHNAEGVKLMSCCPQSVWQRPWYAQATRLINLTNFGTGLAVSQINSS